MEIKSQFAQLDKLKLHYLEAGEGEPVLLLHGWPTSSYLWRNIIPEMAKTNRVIALDLPGFGQSDKPLNESYSFPFFTKVLDDFLESLGIEKLGLALHDLGGPVGLFWAGKNRERISKLAFLNTLVYPEMSWAVVLFVSICRLPIAGDLISSPRGIRFSMRFGVENKSNLDGEPLAAYQAPFVEKAARKALLKTAYGLHPKGFKKIAKELSLFDCPVRIVYGENDRILPDVEKTMTRVKRDLPQAEVSALPGCGHFLQEDEPEKVARLLADFF